MALVAGLLIGVIESLSAYWIGAVYKDMVVYSLFLGFLWFRPQGLMGKYYALAQGEDPSVAAASEDHYKPQGPNDRVPTDPVAPRIETFRRVITSPSP